MNKTCEHDKSYSSNVLLSYPAQYPWICRKCGMMSTDSGLVDKNDYEETVKRFVKKEVE